MKFTLMTVGGIAFIFLMTVLGAALVFCFKKEISPRLNAVFLGLASGIMIAASVWSLLLPAFEQAEKSWGKYTFIPIAIGLLLGAAFLFFFDRLLPLSKEKIASQKPRRLFIAMTLHNIPEGLAAGFAFGTAYAIGTPAVFASTVGLAIGLGIQNFPEGAATALPMRSALKSRGKAFLLGVISGIPELLFSVLGFFLASQLIAWQPWLLAFSAGAMLYVVAEDLLPDSKLSAEQADLKFAPIATWSFMLGFILMMILDVVL